MSSSSSTQKHPYPSNLDVANFVSLKQTQTNYLLWKTQVLSLIEWQDLLSFIIGEIPSPNHEMDLSDGSSKMLNPDLASWTGTNRMKKAWITGTLSKEIL
ncbi:hypothetical protein MRB53_008722 [Persea americana]|uniref:Uncharacterized protein n=1 Tax=Persea americana TaxID=3435 RepID=A0ACC2MMJ5_PERAE|nr:hypothetical protein MRB53_008722 [Persea americana]